MRYRYPDTEDTGPREELHSKKDYTLACCSYLRKIMHRLSFVAVLLALVLAVNVLALFGDALIRSA